MVAVLVVGAAVRGPAANQRSVSERALYLATKRARIRVEVTTQNTERVSPPSTASTSPVT